MTAKIILEVLLLLFAVGYTTCQRRCMVQEDCRLPYECCSKRAFTDEAYCVPLRGLYDVCLKDMDMINEQYDVTCPCSKGLECMRVGYLDNYGEIKYVDNVQRCLNETAPVPKYWLFPPPGFNYISNQAYAKARV